MNERIAIFGAGISGRAARRLAESKGHAVAVFDEREAGDACSFSRSDVEKFDTFIFSPGFAAEHPWRIATQDSGKPVFSELGYGARHWPGKIIGVTGTNGKTTVTELLTAAFCGAGFSVFAAGNIGRPLCDLACGPEAAAESYAVCEISSFQAELPAGLQLDGLLWTNFAEDHLDRYPSMDAYFAAKANLLQCLKPGVPAEFGREVRLRLAEIGQLDDAGERPPPDLGKLDADSVFRSPPQSENFSLVAAFWESLGLPDAALIEAANCFQLAPHRLAAVGRWGGVTFWDDSKATNFHAALAALSAMETPVFWIGGGAGKGGDLAAFARALAPRIEAAHLYGASAETLAAALRPHHPRVEICPRFGDAVEGATRAALEASPATVLLSPGFASFDQFSSYAERGKSFIYKVLSLKNAASTD